MASRPMLPQPPKPDTNQTARKTAAAWNAPGGGYDSFKKMDPQREKDLPPGGKLPAGSTPGSYHPASTAMRPPLSGVMHEGGVVPKTGAYLMKKGEHVLTPEKKNMMHHAMSLASTALSHPDMEEKEPPMPKKSVKEMHIRKGKSGGFIMEHHHAAPAVHPMEEHTAPDMDALHDHMDQHMGQPPDAEAAEGAESPGVQAMESAIGSK
jgi:hypothetical protein